MLLAVCLCVSCVVLDALTAFPPPSPHTIGPSSFRVTSLILIVCLSSPVVEILAPRTHVICFGTLLAITAFLGQHQGDLSTRIADVVYILIFGCIVVFGCVFTLFHSTGKGSAPYAHFQRTLTLTMTLILYVGTRITRNAMSMCSDVMTRSNMVIDGLSTGQELVVAGCSACNAFTMACLATTGTAAAITAFIVLLCICQNTTESIVIRVQHVPIILSISAWVQTLGALGSFFAFADTTAMLEIIYGQDSCFFGDHCAGAFACRRFNVITHATGSCMMVLFATLATRSGIQQTVAQHGGAKSPFKTYNWVLVILFTSAAGITLLFIVAHMDWTGEHWYTDIAMLISVLGLSVSGLARGYEHIGALLLFSSTVVEVNQPYTHTELPHTQLTCPLHWTGILLHQLFLSRPPSWTDILYDLFQSHPRSLFHLVPSLVLLTAISS